MIKRIKRYLDKIKLNRKYKKCNHEWKHFDSGYKQCIHCYKMEKS